ncbi:MAG: peptidase MA family metallohydrolase [Dehalococcoidia bacterium]
MRLARFITVVLVVALVFVSSSAYPVAAKGWITELDHNVEVRFPDDVVFTIEFTSSRPVENVTISFQIVGRESSRREPATLEVGDTLKAEYVLRTRGGAGSLFIPTGAEVTYYWIFEDDEGNTIETEPVTFLYLDTRFDWQVRTEGMVSTYYYGPVETRARTILDTGVETLDRMGALLETALTRPIRLVIYNNPLQMQQALPFVSSTTQSGLVTLGQAYAREGVLIIMAFASNVAGNTSHEITHLLVAQAAEGPGRRVPDWLNEGLAEYGNLEPGFSYDQALLFSIREGRLLPITHMTNRPGTPEDVVLFYGQSRQIVKFMVDTYGAGKMAELLRVFREGSGDIDDALMEVYGFDRVGLDNRWRERIGLPLLPESEEEEVVTTPLLAPPWSLSGPGLPLRPSHLLYRHPSSVT